MTDTGTHMQEILRVAEGQTSPRDADVLASWRRCLNEHQLDPGRHAGARIVTQAELRQHRQESEELLGMARHGMEDLYRRVNALGYVLLLSNAHGVTVDSIGDAGLDRELRHAGLIAGSEWDEAHVGTNGVGACLATGRAITVHRSDHFDSTLTPLSCTAVPVHDTQGALIGILDLSHLQAPQDKISQALILEVMKSCARRVEMANLVRNHRSDWILRLNGSPEFLDVDPMAALAVGPDGRISGMTQNARQLLPGDGSPIGRAFSEIFACDPEDLPKLSRAQAPVDGVLEMQAGGMIFARAVPLHDETAFLMATFTNTSPEPIFESYENSFSLDNTLIGRGKTDRIPAGAEATLAFGPVEDLRLDRVRLDKNEGDSGIINRTNTSREEVRITIENLGARNWPVRLLDLVPVSTQEDLVITHSATPRPDIENPEDKQGLLEWRFDLAPGAEKSILLRHDMQWPLDMILR